MITKRVISTEVIERLRPHQAAPYARLVDILSRYQSAVDLSDMGTGKTFVAAAVATRLRLPTLVVVPKVAVTAWERAAEHFGEKFSVLGYEKLRTGRTPFGWWDNPPPVTVSELIEYFKCQCCQLKVDLNNIQPCYTHHLGIHCIETKHKSWNYGKFNFHPGVRLVIFDEGHRCGGLDSLNAEMMIAAKRQNIKMLMLSATAACNPLNMRALGYNLDLHNDRHDFIVKHPTGFQYRFKPNFYRWAAKYGCRRDARFHGFKWMAGKDQQLQTMAQIRDSFLSERGVRVTTAEIPGFPKCDIQAELYDLDEDGTINWLYGEMAVALNALDKHTADEPSADHPLTKILRARQRIELLKIPIAVELARDALDKGFSVGIFINFAQTMRELQTRLKTDCIIDGSPAGIRHRQRNIDRFNLHESRLILINSEAGGVAVSLPDRTGEHPRLGLVFPGWNASTFRQIMGRFPREDSKSNCGYRVLYAAKTVEVTMHRNMCAKLNNLDQLNSEDMVPENLHLLNTSLSSILNN